jgi:hypothetical protein
MIDEKSSLNKALEVGCEAAALSCLKAGGAAWHADERRDTRGSAPHRPGIVDGAGDTGTNHLIWYVIDWALRSVDGASRSGIHHRRVRGADLWRRQGTRHSLQWRRPTEIDRAMLVDEDRPGAGM